MDEPTARLWSRWKIAIVMVGGLVAAIAALVIAIRPATTTPVRAAEAPVISSTPAASSMSFASPTISGTAAAPKPSTAAANAWPTPKPIQGLSATWDPHFGDPFESDAGLPSDVRELVRVGEFRLGVTNDSKVKNEGAVIAVLTDLGREIDKLDRGRTESFEARVVEYQEIYDRYRPKLAPHMEGSFALKGNGWTDTERLDKPPSAEAGVADAP